MAGRLNTYLVIKKIHLYSALITGIFLLMYFVTGFFMVRYSWFEHKDPDVSVEEREISIDRDDQAAIVSSVQNQLQVRGKLDWYNKLENGEIRLDFEKPGLRTQVTLSGNLKRATVQYEKQDAYNSITILHRLHKYNGGFLYNLFMVLMDLASFSLILFSISGIYLWLKVLQQKFWGILFLALGIAYSFWVIYSLMS